MNYSLLILIFSGFLSALSLFYSIGITKGFYALIKHKFRREISLTWGINLSRRMKEIKYVSIASIFFAIAFLIDITNLIRNVNNIGIPLILESITYIIAGYVVYEWANAIKSI
ncbi:MAG: hypothetical protein QXV12_01850 [Candidatus Rehaiarchaeum fermentans]|nr:hypothetical protein [Candidatus Rehaiarchaeum fermentans]